MYLRADFLIASHGCKTFIILGKRYFFEQLTHFFTPEEANKKLTEIRKLVSDIVNQKKKLDANPLMSQSERRSVIDSMTVTSSRIVESGIEVKDLDMGLIDFPAMRFNEPVYLCWKLGEPEVLYWHGLQEGYAGRKLLRPEVTQVR
jgi:hypothetical protein